MPPDQSPRRSYVLDRGYAEIPRRPRFGPCPEQFRYQASGVEGPTSHINDSKLEGLPCGLRKGEKVLAEGL
jgi:hypothetical protein